MADRKITKGESEFIDQYTRYLLAHVWCPYAVRQSGTLPVDLALHETYVRYAQEKNWISAAKEKAPMAEMVAMKSGGWATGMRFLKR